MNNEVKISLIASFLLTYLLQVGLWFVLMGNIQHWEQSEVYAFFIQVVKRLLEHNSILVCVHFQEFMEFCVYDPSKFEVAIKKKAKNWLTWPLNRPR